MVGLLEVSNSIVTSFRLVTLSLFFRESKFKGRIVLNTFHLIWVSVSSEISIYLGKSLFIEASSSRRRSTDRRELT